MSLICGMHFHRYEKQVRLCLWLRFYSWLFCFVIMFTASLNSIQVTANSFKIHCLALLICNIFWVDQKLILPNGNLKVHRFLTELITDIPCLLPPVILLL